MFFCSMSTIIQRERLPYAWPQGSSSNMDIEEMFDTLVECNDVLLESAVSDVVTGFGLDVCCDWSTFTLW